jgi:phosphatidylglycerophosphate synthase
MINTQMTSSTADAIYMVVFIGIFAIPFLAYLGLAALGAVTLPPTRRKGAGRRLFGSLFVGYYYWFLGPVFRAVERTSLSPNAVTSASLMAAGATAVAISTGHFALASALLIGGSTLDIIDGHLARAKKMATAAGAFFDSTIDRVSDGLVFGGCVVYYANTPMMYVSLAVLLMTYTVSYSRARGETLGVTGPEGLMQRADRIVVLGAALAVSPFFGHRSEGFVPHPFYAVTAGALCLLALLNAVTAVSRITWTMRQLRQSNNSVSGQMSGSMEVQGSGLTPVPSERAHNLSRAVPRTLT